LLLVLTVTQAAGQSKTLNWEAGVSTVAATGSQAPFWLLSNKQGKYSTDRFAASLELGLFTERDTSRNIDFSYGIEVFGRSGENAKAWIHQAYGQVVFYNLVQLRFGSWEEIVGSQEPALSSGSVIWSGNARPVPKIEIGTPGYINVPYTRGFLEIKGKLSHGWLGSERVVSNVLLHHKNVYLRLGGDLPVNIYYGLNHYALWGGTSPTEEEPYPSDFSSFLKVFFMQHGDPDVPGTPDVWVINRFGNHIGSRNYGVNITLDNFTAGIYQQDIFEDGSGLRLQNFPDGLWGAWIRFPEEKKIVQAVVYEHLRTISQSGPDHHVGSDTLGGNDNYFNHGRYRSGWTHYQYTIGTPLITSPLFNDPEYSGIKNNRVIAHHLGFEGYITENIRYRNIITWSRNMGRYSNPFPEPLEQLSWMLELNTTLKRNNMEAGITVAADIGEMYGDNLGVMITFRKKGKLLSK
jgi:hypothetical protein